MKARLIGCAGGMVMAGALVSPLAASADTPASSPSGSARAAAVQVSIAPSALISTDPAIAPLLREALGRTLGADALAIRLGAANAAATLSTLHSDLQSGHADSTALDVRFAPLQAQVEALQSTVKDLLDTVRGAGGTASLASGAGALTGLLGSSPLAGSLAPQLSSLTQTLAPVSSALTGLLDGGGLGDALHGLGADLAGTVRASYNVPGVSDVPVAQAGLTDLNVPKGAPLQLDLAPFHARAVTGALASANSLSGPQASADNDIANVAVTPRLPRLAGSSEALGALHGLLGSLLDGRSGLAAGDGVLTGSLRNLDSLLGPNSLLGGLLNGRLDLNSLVTSTGVLSNAVVQPAHGSGIMSLASTKVADVKVLPLGQPLLAGIAGGALGNPAGILGGRVGGGAGGLAGLALLDIRGVTSSAQADLGPGAGAPTGTSSLGEIDVLGVAVATRDEVLAIPTGAERTIALPGTGLTLLVTRGVPSIGFDTDTHRQVAIAGISVRLVNDGTGILGSLLAGGLTGNGAANPTTVGKTIVDVALANAQADVSAVPVTAPAHVAALTSEQGPSAPRTGMFGLPAVAAAGVLAALAVSLGSARRLAARRRTDR